MDKETSLQKYSKSKKFYCCITEEEIAPERVEYLLGEGIKEYNLTSLNGSNAIYKPKKLIVVDDQGTEFICDKIDETRAWQSERFGGESDDSGFEHFDKKPQKKIEEAPKELLHESLDVVLKKDDNTEDDDI